jgi:sulfatase modifying factor 1
MSTRRAVLGLVAVAMGSATCGGRVWPAALGDEGPEDSGTKDALSAVDGSHGGDAPSPTSEAGVGRRSCAANAAGAGTDCGQNGHDDCCAEDLVPGGSFFMLDDEGASGLVHANHDYPATVSSFRLDRYEITVGRFRQFLDSYPASQPLEGDGANPRVPGSGWQAAWPLPASAGALSKSLADPSQCTSGWSPTDAYWWTDSPGPNEHMPLACATWYELFAFCAWDGGRLVTLAEWQFASTGGGQQRALSWSSPPNNTMVSDPFAVYSSNPNTPRSGPEDVGSRPQGAGMWGSLDLGGNILEVVLDSTVPTTPGSCSDCAFYDPKSAYATLEGGGWGGGSTYMYNVETTTPFTRGAPDPQVGARCAHDL